MVTPINKLGFGFFDEDLTPAGGVVHAARGTATCVVQTEGRANVHSAVAPVITPQLEAAYRWGDLDATWVKPASVDPGQRVLRARGSAIARVTAEAKATVRKIVVSATARASVIKPAKAATSRKPALVAVGCGFVQEEGREVALLLGIPEDFS